MFKMQIFIERQKRFPKTPRSAREIRAEAEFGQEMDKMREMSGSPWYQALAQLPHEVGARQLEVRVRTLRESLQRQQVESEAAHEDLPCKNRLRRK